MLWVELYVSGFPCCRPNPQHFRILLYLGIESLQVELVRMRSYWSRGCSLSECLLHVKSLSCVQLCVTPWTIAHQAPLSMRILQERISEWAALSSSSGSSWPRDRICISSHLHWQAGSSPLAPPLTGVLIKRKPCKKEDKLKTQGECHL